MAFVWADVRHQRVLDRRSANQTCWLKNNVIEPAVSCFVESLVDGQSVVERRLLHKRVWNGGFPAANKSWQLM